MLFLLYGFLIVILAATISLDFSLLYVSTIGLYLHYNNVIMNLSSYYYLIGIDQVVLSD